MRSIRLCVYLSVLVLTEPGIPQQGSDRSGCAAVDNPFFRSGEYCYTPARGPECSRVRGERGDCPGSRNACDWCYGPGGVFAYAPRGSTKSTPSGCDQLGKSAVWSTTNAKVAGWMRDAGGDCRETFRGRFVCSNVDPERFKQASGCAPKPTKP